MCEGNPKKRMLAILFELRLFSDNTLQLVLVINLLLLQMQLANRLDTGPN